MIEIIGTELNQWDTGRSVKVTEASHVHFSNQGDSKAVIMELADSQALIPNYLLQTGKQLCVYAVKDGVTIERKMFSVKKRERPENYVYDDDHRNYIYELITSAEEAVEGANLAIQNANEAADRANKAASSWVMVGEASGESATFNDAVTQPFAGFRIFGKTTQAGTPTPDVPVELVSVGDSGIVTVNVAGASESNSMTIATPNGLPGIPVSSGGNYTDANGQQWVCDEIDFTRSMYIQRINKYLCTGKEAWEKSNIQGSAISSGGLVRYDAIPNPHQPKASHADVLSTHCLFAGTNAYNKESGMSTWVGFDNNVSYLTVRVAADFETNEALKNWLAEQYASGTPLTILYSLATPIETPLSEDQLAAYASLHTYRKNTTVSNDASAYMELEYVMDAKKYIDNLVISGGGSVAKLSTVTLSASKWTGADSLYSQVVTIPGVTPYSKVDLLPSVEQLAIFHNKDVAFVTENEDGVVTVYAIGEKPVLDYTMQVQITEVVV